MSGWLVDGYLGSTGKRLRALTVRARRQLARRSRGPVIITCTLCQHTETGSTWRPVKAAMAAHFAKRHPKSRRRQAAAV